MPAPRPGLLGRRDHAARAGDRGGVARPRKGELITYAGVGHFDIYRGETFERAVVDQIDFLNRHLGT